jgi:hypothetical protein
MTDDSRSSASSGDTLEQTPARMVAGALAHLATHMETGCPQAGYLAAIVLARIAADPEADAHLRRHAQQLVDILEAERSDGAPTAPVETGLRGAPRLAVAYRRA